MHKKCWFSFKFLDRELSLEEKLNKCKQEEKSVRGMYTDGYNLRRDMISQHKFNMLKTDSYASIRMQCG